MFALFANHGDPDQMLHSVVPDLGLQCLPNTLLGVSRLQWVNVLITTAAGEILIFLFCFVFSLFVLLFFSKKIKLGSSCESSAS